MAKKPGKKKTTKKKAAKKPKESSNSSATDRYPRHSVERALRIPRAILDQHAGGTCTAAEAVKFSGGKSLTGTWRLEISSATKYGFLERLAGQKVRPSDLAKKILRPQNDGDEQSGYREAILNAPVLSEVYQQYRGENLPDDKFLKNAVVDKHGISEENYEAFKSILMESLATANLLNRHGDKIRLVDISSDDGASSQPSKRIQKLGKDVKVDASDTCFVMQPFAPPLGSYYEDIYKPAIEKAGLKPIRADTEIFGTGKIMDQIWSGIHSAKVLVAELTGRNPNVFYELGLAHALKKPVVLVSSNEEDVPFDLQHIRVIYYDVSDPFWGNKLVEKVAENILSAIQNPEEAILRDPEMKS